MSGERDRDAELDAYLEGDSALSRAYREQAGEEPPGRLDRRIREAARGRVRHARGPFARTWTVPASLAAVVVLSVSVVVLMGPPDAMRAPGIATEPEAEADTAPPRESLPAGNEPAGVPPAEERLRKSLDSRALGETRSSAASPAPAAADEGERPQSAPAAPASALQPERPAARFSAPRPSRRERQQSAPLESKESIAPVPQQPAAGGGARLLDAPRDDALDAARASGRDPGAWLRDIEALLDAGETAAARESLAAFIEAHPGYPLGERLRAFREADSGVERAREAQ